MVTMTFETRSGKPKHLLEVAEQKLAWAWLGQRKIQCTKLTIQDYSYMVPNGTQLPGSGARRAIYMKSLKAQGFRPGVSDLVIAYPTHVCGAKSIVGLGYPTTGYHGAYIEMKRVREAYSGPAAVKAAIRPEQKEWLARMHSVGYWVAVAYGFEEFKSLVEKYLRGESPPLLDFLKD